MQWADGTKHNPTNDNRVTHSHTATYTVYKSGTIFYAEANFPSGTDYDGTDAATVIQNAIDGLPSDGGIVFIKAGTYPISTRLEVASSNITIQGEGHGTILDGETMDAIILYLYDSGGTIYNVWVKDLQVLGDPTAGTSQFGIELNDCEKSGVIGCYVYQCGRDGIYLYYSDFCVVANNIVEDCTDDGINLNYSTYNVVANNVSMGHTYDGIHVYLNSHINTIIGNVVYNCGDNGIGVGSSATESESNVISGNQIGGCVASGILLDKGRIGSVNGNRIITCAIGIELTNGARKNSITGNMIKDSTNYGISLSGASIDNAIVGNVIDTVTNYDGIIVTDSDDTVITGNRINGCGDRSVEEAGTSDYTLLDGNNVRGNTTAHNVDAANSVVGDNVT